SRIQLQKNGTASGGISRVSLGLITLKMTNPTGSHIQPEYKFHINLDEYDRRATLSADELKVVRRWREENLVITKRQAPRLHKSLIRKFLNNTSLL
ncbi:hypothetical protein, partial [Komagataeibacter oboediens]|uniref:hypothetical protein n=1 Tax=Komagataeibacter oboediens TaxID=65958 RepID=UPI0015E8C745